MEQSLNIRIAEEADVAAIRDIYNEAILTSIATFDTEEKTLEDRMEWFQWHTGIYPLYVAELNGQVVGYASLSPFIKERKAYMQTVEPSLYVDKEYQNKGVGKALYKELIDYARSDDNVHTVIARVTAGNVASGRLHEEHGFQKVGTIKEAGMKFNRYLDVDFFQLIL